MVNAEAIKSEYAPYNKMPEFEHGFNAHNDKNYWLWNKPTTFTGVALQAYDRGSEAAMRVQKAECWITNNVGLD